MNKRKQDDQALPDQLESLKQRVAELESMIANKDSIDQQHRDVESILQMLIKNIPNQVFWKSRDLVYLGCNQAFAEVTGMKHPSEVIGKTDFDFHRNTAHAESYREWDKKIMDKGEAVLDIEESYHDTDGNEGTVVTSKVPLKNAEGQVFGILGICTDITDRKKMELKNESLINELKDTLSKVKTLHGLLPICSNCKGIWDDKGYWNEIEEYLSEHTDVDFSHGICPECFKKLYPDYTKNMKE